MQCKLDTAQLLYYKHSMKRRDVEKLHTDGLITDDLRDKIIQHYGLTENASGRWLLICLSLLATLLFIGGASMMAAAHWAELTTLGKASIGAGLLAAIWIAYFCTRNIPLLPECLALIGGALWIGNICLHQSLFAPRGDAADMVFLFFIGIVFIPFLTRQRLLVGGVAGVSLVFLVILHGLNSPDDSWLYTPWFCMENVFASCSLLLCFWWLLGEKSCKSTGILRGYWWISIPGFLAFISYLSTFILYFSEIRYHELQPTDAGYVMMGAIPVLFLLLKPRDVKWLYWLLLAVSTSALLPSGYYLVREHETLTALIPDFPVLTPAIAAVTICTLYALILMFVGVRCKRASWVNYGAFTSLLVIIRILTNLFESLDNSALALLISGAVVLLFTLLLESQRRRLIKNVKQQTPTPSKA